MTRITLKQLRYFEALATHLHFGRAAEACAVSQPALSMQIQDLEAELGGALVERRHSGVTLTAAGREVAERARCILGDVRDLVDGARHRGKALSGPLHLGVIPTVAPYLLPALLPRLAAEFPALELHLHETQTAVLLAELDAHKLDVLLLALPVEVPGVETMPLFEDRFVLAVPPDCDADGGGADTPAADIIARERLLLLDEGHCLRDQALSYCRTRNGVAMQTFGASSLATIVRMVATGHGVTLLPEIALAAEARAGDVRLMRFAAPEPSRTLGLAWRASSPRRRDFEALGGVIAGLQCASAL